MLPIKKQFPFVPVWLRGVKRNFTTSVRVFADSLRLARIRLFHKSDGIPSARRPRTFRYPISAIQPPCKITTEAGRFTGLAGLADNDDDDDDYDGDGEPHKVALLRLRNTNCRPAAGQTHCSVCVTLSLGDKKNKKTLRTKTNTRVDKHAAHTGILIRILDVSYKLIHVCPLACLPFGNTV